MGNIQYYSHLCACGCGGQIEVKKCHKYNGIPKYIKGHHNRGVKKGGAERIRTSNTIKEQYKNGRKNSSTVFKKGHTINQGSKRTEESKQKNREAHLGKKPSEETRKKQSESMKKLFIVLGGAYWSKGEKNPNWNNGSSLENYPTEFNRKLKRLILERDNNQCQDPNCNYLSKKLDCHHIDYDKKNNNPDNLITLCRSCHGKTNNKKNRKYFTEFYSEIMSLYL